MYCCVANRFVLELKCKLDKFLERDKESRDSTALVSRKNNAMAKYISDYLIANGNSAIKTNI